jgi:hypothetical protein
MLESRELGDDRTKVSPYLRLKPRTLRDVCRALRQDGGGIRCSACAVRDLCENQRRREGAPPG